MVVGVASLAKEWLVEVEAGTAFKLNEPSEPFPREEERQYFPTKQPEPEKLQFPSFLGLGLRRTNCTLYVTATPRHKDLTLPFDQSSGKLIVVLTGESNSYLYTD
ncbi:hypothetical protein WAI453_004448 [Rhynchosporium graminicola]